jgi:hypothetical protein
MHVEGRFANGLLNAAYALPFSAIATMFVHLEVEMDTVLAILMDASDNKTAGYILTAIKSPRGRIDLLTDLLELSPVNQKRPPEYDQIIKEFASVNTARNKFVHGQWWTNVETNEVFFAEEDDHGFGFFASRPVQPTELQVLVRRIQELYLRVREVTREDGLALWRRAALRSQPDAPTPSSSAPPRSALKPRAPRPRSSRK